MLRLLRPPQRSPFSASLGTKGSIVTTTALWRRLAPTWGHLGWQRGLSTQLWAIAQARQLGTLTEHTAMLFVHSPRAGTLGSPRHPGRAACRAMFCLPGRLDAPTWRRAAAICSNMPFDVRCAAAGALSPRADWSRRSRSSSRRQVCQLPPSLCPAFCIAWTRIRHQ